MTERYREKMECTSFVPMPMVIVDARGKIVAHNELISEVFLYDEILDYDFYALIGIRIGELRDAAIEGTEKKIERNDKIFTVKARLENAEDEDSRICVYFLDITDYVSLKSKYEKEKICVARVNVDNFDELKANLPAESQMSFRGEVDKIIRKWCNGIEGSLVNMSASEYIIYFENSYTNEILRSKFPILDEVRSIQTNADFPMSLSIGIGLDGKNVRESREFADAAMDLALGRGGDQAVVRRGNKVEYFGGKLQSVEKGNKGKSRVIAHVLKRLVQEVDQVMIMGHQNPDMDSFGSALGMYRVCQILGVKSSIVLDEVNDSLQAIYRAAQEQGSYNIIKRQRALDMITENTLLIVVDVHRPSYVECPELLDKTEKIAVIDHHRRSVDIIKNPVLQYIESYASSASELVTEILQYTGQRKQVARIEAEGLLGGMIVDTNSFAVKTGVRTFEAAAWLRRAGADTTIVKRLLQSDVGDFKARAKAIASAEITEDGIATSILEGFNQEAQIINAQVADEMLNVRGVRASFVAGRDETGQTVVSARSLGEINVQLIMEKLGGGGHLTTAGAQCEDTPEEVIEMIRNILDQHKD